MYTVVGGKKYLSRTKDFSISFKTKVFLFCFFCEGENKHSMQRGEIKKRSDDCVKKKRNEIRVLDGNGNDGSDNLSAPEKS